MYSYIVILVELGSFYRDFFSFTREVALYILSGFKTALVTFVTFVFNLWFVLLAVALEQLFHTHCFQYFILHVPCGAS